MRRVGGYHAARAQRDEGGRERKGEEKIKVEEGIIKEL